MVENWTGNHKIEGSNPANFNWEIENIIKIHLRLSILLLLLLSVGHSLLLFVSQSLTLALSLAFTLALCHCTLIFALAHA